MKRRQALVASISVLAFSAACAGDRLSGLDCEKDKDCKDGFVCVNKRCVLECSTAADCDDGNVCSTEVCDPQKGCVHVDNAEACEEGNPCTQGDTCIAQMCVAGAAVADGTACDRDSLGSTRDICLAAECLPTRCGDGYRDAGADPAEECDDGNTNDWDGCQGDCTIVPPDLTIVFPPRGATLTGSATVTVRGLAEDTILGLASVTVNGHPVTVGTGGVFTHDMAAAHGLNFVEVIATNTGGKRARRTVGYYWSTAYAPYATNEEDTNLRAGGLVMRLSQEAIDDGDHPCSFGANGYTCTEIDDIATLGEITLNNLDVGASVGTLPIFQRTTNFLTQVYPFDCTDCLDISGLVVAGNVTVTGDVVITSEITTLDFNALALALTARTGGLKADVEVHAGTSPPTPGFTMTVRTTARVPVEAKLLNATGEYAGVDLLGFACVIFFDPATNSPDWMRYVCPHNPQPGGGSHPDPLASLYPQAYADSGLTVGSMVMENVFNITTAPGGGVQVQLVAGMVDFFGSQIEVHPIETMVIDLGVIDVLGAQVDLGSYPLDDIVSGLDGIISDLAGFLLNDLQDLLEPAITLLLLNPNDPLSVGRMVKSAIENVAPNGPVALEARGSQTAAPEVTLSSEITSITCAAPTAANLLTGGITPGLSTLVYGDKVTARTPLGSVLADGCYGTPPPALSFAQTSSLEMAEHLDHLNQALYATWWNGGFDFTFANGHLSPTSPLATERFSFATTFYTAPTLDNCNGAALALQIADAKVVGSFGAGSAAQLFEAFVSASIPVQVTVSGETVGLAAASAGTPLFAVEVTSEEAEPIWAAELETLLEAVLVGEVLLPASGDLFGALPTFSIDLRDYSTDPGAAVLQFLPQSQSQAGGYVKLAGAAGQ